MKKPLFALMLALIITSPLYAQNQVTLKTYYPSPVGAYDRIRLVPRSGTGLTCDPSMLGLLFFDSDKNAFSFCGNSGSFGPLPGTWTQAGNDLYPTDYANSALALKIVPDLSWSLPPAKFTIWTISTSTSGTDIGVYNALSIENTSASSADNYAAHNFLQVWGANHTGWNVANQSLAELHNATNNQYLVGSDNEAVLTGSGNNQTAYGSYGLVWNKGTSLITEAYGSWGKVANKAGTITKAYGITGNIDNETTGTISEAYGLYSKIDKTGGGPITTGYGLYLDTIKGTTNYGLYQKDATNKNYFAGNVGIGTTNPLALLHLTNSSALAVGNVAQQDYTFNTGLHGDFGMILTSTATQGLADFVWKTWNGSVYGEKMRLTSSGNVGIGTNTPTYKFNIVDTRTETVSPGYTIWAQKSNSVLNNTAATTASFGGGLFSFTSNGATNLTSNNYGSISLAWNENTAITSWLYGAEGVVRNEKSGKINYAVGLSGAVRSSSTGTIDNAIGVRTEVIRDAGIITTGYGLYVANTDATTDWGIYQEDASDDNYFAGKVGIGTTTPTVPLEVAGNIIASDPTADNHVATKKYVDDNCGGGGGGGGIHIPTTIVKSAATHTGAFGGYKAMQDWACTPLGAYHVCDMLEIQRYQGAGGVMPGGGDAWIWGGVYEFRNDNITDMQCDSWKTALGTLDNCGLIWRGATNDSFRDTCNNAHYVLCCD